MRNLLLFFSILFVVGMSSCGVKEKLVVQEMYTKYTAVNDTLDKLTTQWHSLRDQASISKNYAPLAPARIALGSFISRARSWVANIPQTKENERLKSEEDALLLQQSNLVSEVYPTFEQFNEYTPKEVVDKNLSLLNDDLLNLKTKIAEVKKRTDAMAKKYDVKK